jgi:alkaline phosphatase D
MRMRMDRRRALALLGLGAAPVAAKAADTGAVSFRHGIASGDPRQDAVVLWTRITPAKPGAEIAYRWRLNPIDRRAGGARSGSGVTGPARDYTAKADVTGLDPGRAYTFEFEAAGVTSPMGRTRTLPAGRTEDAVIAVASCALYPNGYFNAYRAIADLPRLDLVLHLGDYVYEYGGAGSYGMDSPVAAERPHDPPHEAVSLADYRRRHAQYKTDPALQAAHARAPWIVVWDDHETCNDSYAKGGENHQPATEGAWTARKAAALKAYYEWMPIRDPAAGKSLAFAAARSFDVGDLARIVMLETRLTARGKQLDYATDFKEVDGKPDVAGFRRMLNDPGRRMMGPQQEAWLADQLKGSVKAGHAWQILGSGVVMGRIKVPNPQTDIPADAVANLSEDGRKLLAQLQPVAELGLPWGLDMWDGYPADRERVYDLVKAAGARLIVVSGDRHALWANVLSDASGRRVACEFGGTSVTSPSADDYFKTFASGPAFEKVSDEVVFCDQGSKGFMVLTMSRDGVRADLMAVSTITAREFTTKAVKSFRVTPDGAGASGLNAV